MPPPSGVPAAREDEDWRFVEPRVGCAIVNVADSLQRATEGRLMSCLHRVGQPAPVPEPSEQDRVCVLYYLRPGKVPAESGANGTNGHP
jgi:isopenicillin N synthase-like dioxygenase